jgi:general nucleoside transport system permease protein
VSDFLGALADIFSADATYNSAFQLAVLFAFAAVGEWVSERSGALNISVEAMLLAGAFGAAMGFQLGNLAIMGLLVGMAAGVGVASVQANLSHRLSADQFVVGLALNVLVFGLAAFLDSAWGPGPARAATFEIPLLVDIPLVGQALFGRPWPAYFVYAFVPLMWWLVFRTRWGLEVRASGENPQSADVSGVDVNARRRQTIYLLGITAGFGGAFVVLGQVGQFQPSIIGGRGFIAIAAVLFGGWTLRGTVLGCLIFGLVEAVAIAAPVKGYEVDPFFLDAAPYFVAIVVMMLFARRVREPAALTRPFIRGLK